MGVLDEYTARMTVVGQTKRDSVRNQTLAYLSRNISSSLSYQTVAIDNINKQLMIIDTEDLNIKKIHAVPNEVIPHGSLIQWKNNMWLITEVDAHNELYMSGVMQQCNHVLKWLNNSGQIVSHWCIVEDGTKYLIGEKQEDMMSIGDARIAITIGRDAETVYLNRGMRFLIDDPASTNVLAYQITKPNKLFNIFNGNGIYRFILNEVNLTDDDNVELRVADYYNRPPSPAPTPDDDKEVWL